MWSKVRDLILRSVLVALIGIPFIAAYDRNPRRALKKVVWLFGGFCVFYMLALRFVYPSLGG
mgnify:FL=1